MIIYRTFSNKLTEGNKIGYTMLRLFFLGIPVYSSKLTIRGNNGS